MTTETPPDWSLAMARLRQRDTLLRLIAEAPLQETGQ